MFRFPDNYTWLLPWVVLPDNYTTLIPINWPDETFEAIGRDAIVDELRREMPESHLLHGLELDAVAVNVECGYKDFVFTTTSADSPIVTAHLTYNVESNPLWPSTHQFANLDHWEREMELDYEHFGKPALDCKNGHYRRMFTKVDGETIDYCCRCGKQNKLPG